MPKKNSTANPGDLVSITVKSGTTHAGTLLPRPHLLEGDITVLKLESGYNIGIDNATIKDIVVTKALVSKAKKNIKTPHNPKLKTVVLISFGGTISSRIDYRSGGVYADYDAGDFVAMCPELKDIANVVAVRAKQMMSEDMSPADWKEMSQIIAQHVNKKNVAGVVVTQGTDTLHYSASAMSLMLQGIHKPVILTASQRSIDRGSSDAFMNLICAVSAASKIEGGIVATCMHGQSSDSYCELIRGTKVRKMHTSRRDAFRPINDIALGKVWPTGKLELNNSIVLNTASQKTVVMNSFGKVGMITVYPGIQKEQLQYFIDKKFKGVVVGATALGHVPFQIIPTLKKMVASGITVVIATQTLYGRVHPYVYTALRNVSVGAGCVFAEDMSPEMAYVKLGWVLGQEKKQDKVIELFLKNIAGEINDQLTEEMYLN